MKTPYTGPVAIPAGHALNGHAIVKFACACGKRVTCEFRHHGRAGACPGCGAELIYPDVTRAEKIWIFCPCGAPVVAGRNDCGACGRILIFPPAKIPSAPRGWLPVAVAMVALVPLLGYALLKTRTVPPAAPPVARREEPVTQAPPIRNEPVRSETPKLKPPQPVQTVVEPASPPEPLPKDPPAPVPAEKSSVPSAPVESAWDILVAPDLPPRPAPAPGDRSGAPRSAAPDLNYFTRKLQPVLEELCLRCHADPALPVGKYVLVPRAKSGFTAAATKKNFEASLAFADLKRPEASPLLTKPLAIEEGGVEHGGGDNLDRKSAAYATLLGFLRGDAPEDAKPTADPGPDQTIEVGKSAHLDGSRSRDSAGQEVKFRWEIVQAPRGSAAQLVADSGKETSFRTDRAGTWLVELVVVDSAKVKSDPARVRIRARPARAKGAKAPAGGPAEDEGKLRELLRRFRGNEPDAAEIAWAQARDAEELAADLVADAGVWRGFCARDLTHFDLVDAFRPAALDVERAAVQIANGELTPIAALAKALTDPAFARRYPNARDAAGVLHRRLLGVRDDRPAALDALLARDAFFELYLTRHHRALLGTAPAAADLARWTQALRADPMEMGSIVREWVAATAR